MTTFTFMVKIKKLLYIQNLVKMLDGRFTPFVAPGDEIKSILISVSFEDMKAANRFGVCRVIIDQPFF